MTKNILIALSSLILLLSTIDLQSSYGMETEKVTLAFKEKSELYKLHNQGKLILIEIRKNILKNYSKYINETIKQQIQFPNELSNIVCNYLDDNLILASEYFNETIKQQTQFPNKLSNIVCNYLGDNLILASDLFNLFNLCMTDEIISKISQFLTDSEKQVDVLIKNNSVKFNQYRNAQVRSTHWPHTPDLRRTMERNNFVFRPMMIKLDRMVCEKCSAQPHGLSETDIPQYYHNANCKEAIGRNCDTDSTLKVLQRLNFVLTNYQINFFNKSDSEKFENKKINFLQLCNAFNQLPGWIQAEYYILMNIYRPEKFINTLFAPF